MATAADSGQRRVRTAIVLTTLSTTAFLIAQGSTQLLASAFLDLPPEPAGPFHVASATTTQTHTRDGHPLLEHNIFDSKIGPIPWDDPTPAADETPEADVPIVPMTEWHHGDAQPPQCDGSIRLVGSYVRRSSMDESFAAIINATGSSRLYREGMQIDERRVLGIEPRFVVLAPATGAPCSISMFETEAPAVVAAVAAPVVTAPVEGGDTGLGLDAAELDANVHQLSETSYTINRTLVDRLLANQAALMSAARVIPHEEDGHVVGVKIYGIRRSSLLGRLGIQNGDMLRTINGYDMTDPTAILDAYSHLRTADHLSLSVVRRGQPMSMDYAIQ